MTTDSEKQLLATMGRFQQELMRWNRQISLVSRRDTLKRTAALIGQARACWHALEVAELADWRDDGPFSYFDLGSGGGIPGFVWHQLLVRRFGQARSFMVEPRSKRAWFLERLNGLQPESPFSVLAGRWGELPPAPPLKLAQVLISLKALRLPDPTVLDGLARLAATGPGVPLAEGGRLIVARFYPPDQEWTGQLEEALRPLADPARFGGLRFEPTGRGVVAPAEPGPTGAALVTSAYRIVAAAP